MKTCETCGAPIVRESDESRANHKKRVTCRTRACRDPHKLKATHRSNERKKKRDELLGKEKHKRPFRGKLSQAAVNFLHGGGSGQTH